MSLRNEPRMRIDDDENNCLYIIQENLGDWNSIPFRFPSIQPSHCALRYVLMVGHFPGGIDTSSHRGLGAEIDVLKPRVLDRSCRGGSWNGIVSEKAVWMWFGFLVRRICYWVVCTGYGE